MANFFDRFKPSDKNKASKNNNPLSGLFGGGSNATSSFGGQGQSLGGSQPGKVIPITLEKPGPLGIRVEKRAKSNTAIVAMVVPDSQAAEAGLERGDVLCFAGSNGSEEILYDMFLQLAASDQRPLCFEVRRVPKTKANSQQQTTTTTNAKNETTKSAEAYARKQAVIAAAEKREKAHKKTTKPIPKTSNALPKLLSTADKQKLEDERRQRIEDDKAKELSQVTKDALQKAKQSEQQTAAELGYNPYETKRITSGQARNAVTTTTHGNIQASDGEETTSAAPGTVSAPKNALKAEGGGGGTSKQIPTEFQQAFETTVTSNADHAAAISSINILRKLIVNATTKGQASSSDDDEASAKFRKIRLANPKIKAAVTDVPGAVDLLLATGFQLHSDDETQESVLIYPAPGVSANLPPSWLPAALQQMEQYAQS